MIGGEVMVDGDDRLTLNGFDIYEVSCLKATMNCVLPEHDPVTHGAHLNLRLNFSPEYMEPAASFIRAGAGISGIQEHTGILTKSLRREFGEAHTELKPKIPKSKNPEYVSGYDARRRDEKN